MENICKDKDHIRVHTSSSLRPINEGRKLIDHLMQDKVNTSALVSTTDGRDILVYLIVYFVKSAHANMHTSLQL